MKYDTSIQPGDFVFGYHKGYWRVDVINLRPNTSPTIEYTRIDTKKPIHKTCDGAWCTKINPEALRDRMIAEAESVYEMFMKAHVK